jgi:hypothetical protein
MQSSDRVAEIGGAYGKTRFRIRVPRTNARRGGTASWENQLVRIFFS